jgi:hypothetical protein
MWATFSRADCEFGPRVAELVAKRTSEGILTPSVTDTVWLHHPRQVYKWVEGADVAVAGDIGAKARTAEMSVPAAHIPRITLTANLRIAL